MTAIHLTEDDLVLHYYGETDAASDAGVSAHLSSCASCHDSYARLQRVLAAVDTMPEAEIDEGFERNVWARLQPALDRRVGGRWNRWFLFSPVPAVWAAALVVLVAGAFIAGRVWDRTATAPPAATASAETLRERLLLVALADHLERSQGLLVDLASARRADDISSERTRAEDLLASTRLYRQTASAAGDAALTDLLDEIERVLVDVTAGAPDVDLDASRERVDSVLFKVRVFSSTMRERQKATFRMRAGQSS